MSDREAVSCVSGLVLELPAFVTCCLSHLFNWGDLSNDKSIGLIESYAESGHSTRNLLKVPSGRAGKAFVKELSSMMGVLLLSQYH